MRCRHPPLYRIVLGRSFGADLLVTVATFEELLHDGPMLCPQVHMQIRYDGAVPHDMTCLYPGSAISSLNPDHRGIDVQCCAKKKVL